MLYSALIPFVYRILSKVKYYTMLHCLRMIPIMPDFIFVIPICASLVVWFRCQKFSHCQF